MTANGSCNVIFWATIEIYDSNESNKKYQALTLGSFRAWLNLEQHKYYFHSPSYITETSMF